MPSEAWQFWLKLIIPTLAIVVAALSIYGSIRSNNDTERARERAALAAQTEQENAAFELAASHIVWAKEPASSLASAPGNL